MNYGRRKMYLRLTIIALFLLLTVGCKPTPIEPTPTPEPTIENTAVVETVAPDRRSATILYTLQQGDTLSSIAESFHLSMKTIVAANSESNLVDLRSGMVLRIPPQDGLYHQWLSGDTLEGLAGKYAVPAQDILDWPENAAQLDVNNRFQVGAILFIPGGKIEFIEFTPPAISTP